jgi:predicted DNA-binding protein with PD1-like motif
MRERLIHESGGQRTFAIVLESGDEVMSCLKRFVEAKNLDAAQFSAIGAFSKADLAYFDWEQKKYLPNPVEEQVEVASFTGDVALGPDGKPALHVHCVLGRRDGSALAGHLTQAHVRPTLEIVLSESPAHLRKRHDPESGLALIDLGASSAVAGGDAKGRRQ